MIVKLDTNSNNNNNNSGSEIEHNPINKLGNKGKFLLQMKTAGFNVPDGFILDSDIYDITIAANGLREKLDSILPHLTMQNVKEISCELVSLWEDALLPDNICHELDLLTDDDTLYAVRSSGLMEDLASHSFAGQYDTFLNVKKEDIASKVIGCYQSMFREVLLQYLVNNNLDTAALKMSVIVQEMVPAQYSGICFSVNPSTGEDKVMLIEVSKGLGENIVSGRTAPEQYFYNWYDQKEIRRNSNNSLLSPSMVDKCAKVFEGIQLFFGYPCDIEFAVYNEEVFILQSRQITKLQYNGIKDMWTTADFKDGGVSATVCTPYMWSLYEYIWDYSLRNFIVKTEILTDDELPDILGEMFYGRPYWNMSAVKKAMSQVIGYKEREFDNEYGITGNYEGDGATTKITPKTLHRMLRIVLRQSQLLRHRRKNAQRYKSDLLKRYYLDKKKYDTNQIKDIEKDFYRITKSTYLRSETTYFWQIFINTIHQSLYKDSLLKYVSESEYLALLGSINNISHLLPFYEMWDVSRDIRNNADAFEYWKSNDINELTNHLSDSEYCMPEVDKILQKYGYHSDKELDITYPCYYENPSTIVSMVKDMVVLDDSFSPNEDKEKGLAMQKEVLDKIAANVSPKVFKKVHKKVINMRDMLWWREEFRDISTRFYYLLRVYTIEYAKLLAKQGILENIEDVWFLKVKNLWDFIDDKCTADELQTTIEKNKRYYNSYRNYISDNEIGTVFSDNGATTKDNASSGIKGLGANNGTVTGVARVIEDFTEIDRLKEGDILITKFTDTGWTPKFAILSGIVTEYGGILCHAAIVSREYGIPAIVCCKDAMKKIRDGQIITVNGATGTVTINK
ncbi:MAG: phosphoenolpyruvate synthase [Lachnospiraceae bacterium]|nr:phosphoenolpyruvate synthase [Lachnospiraceae bacterium]